MSQAEATRQAILDAVVRCFAVQGWAGTTMSLVSRETGMTRGKIQYYFPSLEDMKYAAIEHLHECARRNYYEQISLDASPRERFDMGIELFWRLASDPLHIAMAEIGAAARTDSELRQRLVRIRAADESARDEQASASFPALAAVGHEELQLARLFTTVFVNGLAAHSFPDGSTIWQSRLIGMLKECLADFWTRRGVSGLNDTEPSGADQNRVIGLPSFGSDARADHLTDEVLALLEQAAALLAKS